MNLVPDLRWMLSGQRKSEHCLTVVLGHIGLPHSAIQISVFQCARRPKRAKNVVDNALGDVLCGRPIWWSTTVRNQNGVCQTKWPRVCYKIKLHSNWKWIVIRNYWGPISPGFFCCCLVPFVVSEQFLLTSYTVSQAVLKFVSQTKIECQFRFWPVRIPIRPIPGPHYELSGAATPSERTVRIKSGSGVARLLTSDTAYCYRRCRPQQSTSK